MTLIITIDNILIPTKPMHKTILQVLNHLYYNLPHFCYSKKLFISGNCRMCLIEVLNIPKPVVSCSIPVSANNVIFTKSALALKARENVLEFLLINHPLDCPICDQGGECDLQEYSESAGQASSRYSFFKKATTFKNLNKLITTSMNRCINCTKCIRLSFKMGINSISLFSRSLSSEIYSFNSVFTVNRNENFLFNNLIAICPVFDPCF